MSLKESAVLPKAGHLISLPSRFWGEGWLSVMDTHLWICSTAFPSPFVPRVCSRWLSLPVYKEGTFNAA